jgi:hypothetical protein
VYAQFVGRTASACLRLRAVTRRPKAAARKLLERAGYVFVRPLGDHADLLYVHASLEGAEAARAALAQDCGKWCQDEEDGGNGDND